MPKKIKDIHPTRSAEALAFVFKGCVNVRQPEAGLRAFGAKIRHGDAELWLTRVEGLHTDFHVASHTLELALKPPVSAWEGREPGSNFMGDLFWPTVSNESMAKCFCGDLGAARELFLAIEALFATDMETTFSLLKNETVGGDCPLQIYLHEFEPEGLGIVHFTFGNFWTGPLQTVEDKLRAKIPKAFAKLPGSYASEDFQDPHDWAYCSDDFIESTSPKMALAAWSHCLNQENLRSNLTSFGSKTATILALLARDEAEKIAKETKPGKASAPTPRV